MTVIHVYCTFETVIQNLFLALVRTTDLIRLVTYSIFRYKKITILTSFYPTLVKYDVDRVVFHWKWFEHFKWRLCDIVSVIACFALCWKWMVSVVIHFHPFEPLTRMIKMQNKWNWSREHTFYLERTFVSFKVSSYFIWILLYCVVLKHL